MKKISALISKIIFYIYIVVSFFIAGLLIFAPLKDQFVSWMKYGDFSKRDLYWAIADPACELTGWQSRGFAGMDVCRQEYIKFTDWVGVDRIINWIFGLHISLIGVLALLIVSIIYGVIYFYVDE